MENITLQDMGNKYFSDGQEAEYNSNYVDAIECFAIARTFYEAGEDIEGLELVNEYLVKLLEYIRQPDTFNYWAKYGVKRVDYFIQISKERERLFELECEYEDPIFAEMRKNIK